MKKIVKLTLLIVFSLIFLSSCGEETTEDLVKEFKRDHWRVPVEFTGETERDGNRVLTFQMKKEPFTEFEVVERTSEFKGIETFHYYDNYNEQRLLEMKNERPDLFEDFEIIPWGDQELEFSFTGAKDLREKMDKLEELRSFIRPWRNHLDVRAKARWISEGASKPYYFQMNLGLNDLKEDKKLLEQEYYLYSYMIENESETRAFPEYERDRSVFKPYEIVLVERETQKPRVVPDQYLVLRGEDHHFRYLTIPGLGKVLRELNLPSFRESGSEFSVTGNSGKEYVFSTDRNRLGEGGLPYYTEDGQVQTIDEGFTVTSAFLWEITGFDYMTQEDYEDYRSE